MNRLLLIFLILIAGCAELEDQSTTSETATKPIAAGLPIIPKAQIENSVVLDMTATVRRLQEATSTFATSGEFSSPQSEGMIKDLERLQEKTPPESEQIYWDECVAVTRLVQAWPKSKTKLDPIRDLLPIGNRVKELKVGLRINSFDHKNEPLIKAISDTQVLVVLPQTAGAKKKLDEADTLAASAGTDDKAAELTKAYLAQLRQLISSPDKDLRKKTILAHKAAVWEMKLDPYRFYQLERDQRAEAANKSRNHILNRRSQFDQRVQEILEGTSSR